MTSIRKLCRLPPNLALKPEQLSSLTSFPHNPIRTTRDLLVRSELELIQCCNLESEVVESIMKKCAKWIAPKNKTALELLKASKEKGKEAFLSTSLPSLDQALGGGIHCSSLTELVGPANSGKTQFCLTLSILATMPTSMNGLDGGVCYIDTQGAFSGERLVQIAQNKFPQIFDIENIQWEINLKKMTDSIHVIRIKSSNELKNRLENLQEFIIENNIRLLIIDSFGALIRTESLTQNMNLFNDQTKTLVARSHLVVKLATILKFLSESFNMATVVTNHIITVYQQTKTVYESSGINDVNLINVNNRWNEPETFVKAALGNTWAHSVNTRLWIDLCKYHPVILRVNPSIPKNVRKIIIKKSPIGPNKAFYFMMEVKGMVEYKLSKDLNKDLGEDLNKDLGEDLNKDLSKDLGEDLNKDLNKDLSKDLGKQGAEEIYVYQIAMET
ncbi:530_t:CDS:2 [Diversispora eburnea]|uniref:530_t:CDS:1 n=1 Tax=Diversispora eburnea TaxID=1213867 RepID=A0A9N9B0N4_9GLOM|nr:530_t:CDS:2 [Diversispora eburnea]